MTVHHLVTTLDAGGTERQAIQLANALHQSGRWSVLLDSLHADGPMRGALHEQLRTQSMAFPLTRFASWRTLRQLRRLVTRLRRERVRIVHTHGLYANVFGMAAAFGAGVPVRIASKRESVTLRGPALARLERVAFSLATHLLANCHAVRAELVAVGLDGSSISVIHNALHAARGSDGGASPTRTEGTAARTNARAAGHPTIVMVANFHHEAKDHATLLRAACRVVAAAPHVRFVLAGEGPRRAQVEELSGRLGLGENVIFPGRCDDVPSLLADADIGVLSSRSEGFPNVVLEYMAAARPVVTTDAGGVREVVEDGVTGRVVGIGDDASMAQALLELLGDAARRARMGDAGRERVREAFTPERQLQNIEALYDAELARRGATRR